MVEASVVAVEVVTEVDSVVVTEVDSVVGVVEAAIEAVAVGVALTEVAVVFEGIDDVPRLSLTVSLCHMCLLKL